MNAIEWGTIATILAILGTIVKIISDYNKVKSDIEALEKEDKDIRLDVAKDIQRLEDKHSTEIDRLRDDFKAEKNYTHESFVKVTSEQKITTDSIKELSSTLKSLQETLDLRLTSLEKKIDTITTTQVRTNA